ncbi:MAG TPA: purine-nucleoside phosphorylase, partial [Chloroflexi bacterium]|nr:purine-nucleoside phosphorylase [Chloroflexota bacterium]
MEPFVTMEVIEEAAAAVRRRLADSPQVGIILGSGLGGVAEAVESATVIPYTEIPHFPQATV